MELTKEELIELEIIKKKFVILSKSGYGCLVRVDLMSEREARIYHLSCNPDYYKDSGEDEEERVERGIQWQKENRQLISENNYLRGIF